MDIVLFSHPDFSVSRSMPRYTRFLFSGMKERGHKVEIWSPEAFFFSFPGPSLLKKWLGYIDQYIIFPALVRKRVRSYSPQTLFVFIDQGLGMWVPLVKDRLHVVHCHDFIAQQAAFGTLEKPMNWTGRKYQYLIRKGYREGKHFISVSEKTQRHLHQNILNTWSSSEVVYNGLNYPFRRLNPWASRLALTERTGIPLEKGYLLHVGGNQWYKNRTGVIQMYSTWRNKYKNELPLLLVGVEPNPKIKKAAENSGYQKDIFFMTGFTDYEVQLAYSGATVFIFPSLAEGFGWPIAEAMASGCPVITTDDAPMKEVAGNAGFLIPPQPYNQTETVPWVQIAADRVDEVVSLSPEERDEIVVKGLKNAKRFDSGKALDRIERIYERITNCVSQYSNESTTGN